MQKGTLPLTGIIDFIFNEMALSNLAEDLIRKLNIDAIISFPNSPHITKKRIHIKLLNAISPGDMLSVTTNTHTKEIMSIFTEATITGIGRSLAYFSDHIVVKKSWVLFGTVGETEKPIVIIFLPALNTGTFSFKKEKETDHEFNPTLN